MNRNNSHLHRAEVFSNAALHDEASLMGTIKSCGRKRPLEDDELTDEWVVADWQRFEPADKPIYRIQPKVKDRKDKIDGIMKMEEKGMTLESIWTPKEANNVSDGQCSNAEIAVIYTYDFSGTYTYIHHSLIPSLDCQTSGMCTLLAFKTIYSIVWTLPATSPFLERLEEL